MNKRIVSVLLVLFVVLFSVSTTFTGHFLQEATLDEAPLKGETFLVERVIDGDTLVIEGGERVRLLGIDTPETGQHLFSEATSILKELVEGKLVRLEKDITDRDKYDRLLRYIHINGMFVNTELLKHGMASTLFYEPDIRYQEEFLQAEALAREAGLGVWAFPAGDFCLGIFRLHYNARGDDNDNLNDEYVTFRNKCFHPISLDGLLLKDHANASFSFPDIMLANKSTVTLHTGSGKDSATDLFWGKTRAVWNNNGDSLTIWHKGEQLLQHTYQGFLKSNPK
ncbi:MAG: thermonuclease family protein [Candidatus Aenigmarchaeota archaeon]|nr:thermonuclease family protein [Candidatus Aenigmarchaeota archaeon]